MAISAAIGAGFGLLLGPMAATTGRALAAGALYGASWWVLGPLLLMPLMMGMAPQVANAGAMLPSLMGHVVFGLVTGAVFHRLVAAPAGVIA